MIDKAPGTGFLLALALLLACGDDAVSEENVTPTCTIGCLNDVVGMGRFCAVTAFSLNGKDEQRCADEEAICEGDGGSLIAVCPSESRVGTCSSAKEGVSVNYSFYDGNCDDVKTCCQEIDGTVDCDQ